MSDLLLEAPGHGGRDFDLPEVADEVIVDVSTEGRIWIVNSSSSPRFLLSGDFEQGGTFRVSGVSAGEGHARFWKGAMTMPMHPRTYEDDIRAQLSALWAEDWDSDEDAVYDGDW